MECESEMRVVGSHLASLYLNLGCGAMSWAVVEVAPLGDGVGNSLRAACAINDCKLPVGDLLAGRALFDGVPATSRVLVLDVSAFAHRQRDLDVGRVEARHG